MGYDMYMWGKSRAYVMNNVLVHLEKANIGSYFPMHGSTNSKPFSIILMQYLLSLVTALEIYISV